jgi:hypothetical protein
MPILRPNPTHRSQAGLGPDLKPQSKLSTTPKSVGVITRVVSFASQPPAVHPAEATVSAWFPAEQPQHAVTAAGSPIKGGDP